MSFSLSGSVITQSGTDTSLAGLAGIAGVTVLAGTKKTIYYLNASGLSLTVSGSLSIAATQNEMLIFGASCAKQALLVSGASAVLTVGADIAAAPPRPADGVHGVVMLFQRSDILAFENQFVVQSGGLLQWRSGDIEYHGRILIASTASASTGYIRNARMLPQANDASSQPGRLYVERAGFTVGPQVSFDGEGLGLAAGAVIDGVAFNRINQYNVFQLSNNLEVSNLSFSDTSFQLFAGYNAAYRMTATDISPGIDVSIQAVLPAYSASYVEVHATVQGAVTTQAGAAVVGAKYFMRDVDDGNRAAVTVAGTVYDTTADIVYYGATDAQGKFTRVLKILDFTADNPTASGLQTGTRKFAKRIATTGTARFAVKAYGYVPGSLAVATAGTGTKAGSTQILADTAVTLSEAAAGALATLATLDDLHDAAKHWSVQDANLEYPTAATQPLTSSGGAVDLGDLDLVIDATAGAAFSINTGTGVCTVKASTLAAGSKHTRLTTTGAVSTANGATITALYTDASGTSATLTLAGLQDASVLLVDGSSATVEFQAAQSGEFDYVYNFAPGATGTWKWVAKAPGREHATGTFTPGSGGAFSYAPVLTQKLTPSGDPMYTGTTSALVSVSIPGTTTAYIDIGDGTAPLQESFNETELALVTQAGLEWLAAGKDDVSVFDSGSGDYLFLTAGWRLRRASAGDANAAIEAYVTSADGVIVDDTNGPVLYLTSNTPATIAAAVWAYIDRELTQAIPTAAQIADTMLGRNLAGGSDGGRTVRDALRASRNKSAISGSTLTIYQEDDATPAWTAAVSTAERDALQSIDPA